LNDRIKELELIVNSVNDKRTIQRDRDSFKKEREDFQASIQAQLDKTQELAREIAKRDDHIKVLESNLQILERQLTSRPRPRPDA
jgi:SMC interacting uncharacterized protein involved in chromosome segregation